MKQKRNWHLFDSVSDNYKCEYHKTGQSQSTYSIRENNLTSRIGTWYCHCSNIKAQTVCFWDLALWSTRTDECCLLVRSCKLCATCHYRKLTPLLCFIGCSYKFATHAIILYSVREFWTGGDKNLSTCIELSENSECWKNRSLK